MTPMGMVIGHVVYRFVVALAYRAANRTCARSRQFQQTIARGASRSKRGKEDDRGRGRAAPLPDRRDGPSRPVTARPAPITGLRVQRGREPRRCPDRDVAGRRGSRIQPPRGHRDLRGCDARRRAGPDRQQPQLRSDSHRPGAPGGATRGDARSEGLRRLIRFTLRADRFDELRLPLTVVATEVLTGHVRRLSGGALVPALLASSALRGVFPTLSIDGCPLWDGGSVANVPLRPALTAARPRPEPRTHCSGTGTGRSLPVRRRTPTLSRMAGAPHHDDRTDAVTLP
jgi:hypothetical protein